MTDDSPNRRITVQHNDGDPVETLRRIVAPALEARLADGSQWPMYRGNPSRNAVSGGSSPLLSRRWSVPVTDENGAVEPVVDPVVAAAWRSVLGSSSYDVVGDLTVLDGTPAESEVTLRRPSLVNAGYR